jgi:hypothetical protein
MITEIWNSIVYFLTILINAAAFKLAFAVLLAAVYFIYRIANTLGRKITGNTRQN